MRISDLGESALIHRIREQFRNPGIRLGIGDDAAIIDVPAGHSVVYCSDLLAENTHFIRNLHPADSVGYKSVAVNVSDVGAMGGTPMAFTISIALPDDLDVEWLNGFLAGVSRACREFDVVVAGGDSSSAERIFIDVSMIGRVETGREVRRSGAIPGDGIYVSGPLGASALGLEHLTQGDSKHLSVQRHLYPTPPYRLGPAVAAQAHAMIDISDGLSTDLQHILEESDVSARLFKNLLPAAPEATDAHVLHGGEEYQLLIVAPELPAEIDGVPLTRIGEIIEAVLDRHIFMIDGSSETILHPLGYQHFAEKPPDAS